MIKSLKDILVVADMDNTLLTPQTGIPQCNIETIRLFCALGGNFTVATGRTVESVSRYMNKLTVSAPGITNGGGILYDFASEKILKAELLIKPTARSAIMDIKKNFRNVGIEIMSDSGKIHVVQANEFTYRHTFHEKLSYVNCEMDDVKGGWVKVLFATDNEMQLRIKDFIEARNYPEVYFIQTNDVYYEIMPKGVTKGTALKELAAHMNIPMENTFAIGDYYNDIELLNTAGYAVAMGNAPIEVKMAAHEITASCIDGGVGQFLYKLIKQYS
ncbi:MAG: Cof-type HAD-IIB family hydrolase [Oscillospiraceae bacterium]